MFRFHDSVFVFDVRYPLYSLATPSKSMLIRFNNLQSTPEPIALRAPHREVAEARKCGYVTVQGPSFFRKYLTGMIQGPSIFRNYFAWYDTPTIYI